MPIDECSPVIVWVHHQEFPRNQRGGFCSEIKSDRKFPFIQKVDHPLRYIALIKTIQNGFGKERDDKTELCLPENDAEIFELIPKLLALNYANTVAIVWCGYLIEKRFHCTNH